MTESTNPHFNPSGNPHVDYIKRMTEELMAYVGAACPNNRQRSIAITNYEQACMWAVKSLFTEQRVGW